MYEKKLDFYLGFEDISSLTQEGSFFRLYF